MHHILTGRIPALHRLRLIHCTNHGKNIPYMHCFISVCNPNLVSFVYRSGAFWLDRYHSDVKGAIYSPSRPLCDVIYTSTVLVAVHALRIALYYHIYCSIGYRASIVFHHQSRLPDASDVDRFRHVARIEQKVRSYPQLIYAVVVRNSAQLFVIHE
jgi:hypothetical protein